MSDFKKMMKALDGWLNVVRWGWSPATARPLPTREEIVNALHGDNCPDDPEPDWANAPAVVAFEKGRVGDPQVFARENEDGTQWVRDTKVYRWDELTGVVPLYPKEGQES